MIKPEIKIGSERIIPIGLLLLALFWFGDAFFDAHLFSEGTLRQQLIAPELHELVMRSFFALVFMAFIFYVKKLMIQHSYLEAELKSAFDEAAAEKEKTIAIVSAMGDGISIQDPNLRITYQNDAHKALVGDHLGEYCYRAYQLREEPCEFCDLVKSFLDGKVYSRESSPAFSEGKIHVEIISSSLRDKTGKVIAGIEMVRDITKRKQTEATIERQANLLQRLIETMPSPIFYKDRQGIFLGCNDAFAHCSGIARNNIIGKNVFELFPPDLAASLDRMDQELFADPGVQIYESTIPCADSSKREVIFNKATFTDADGALGGLVGIVIDITDHKESENRIKHLNQKLSAHAVELAAANKELEAFSYSVSHDLRTPLTRIYSASQALEDSFDSLDENGRFFVRTISEACEQMEELIEALLELSQVTTSEMRSKEYDLSRIVQEIYVGLSQREPGRTVVFEVAPNVTAFCDAELARVVLENLLSNAWKYTSKRQEAKIQFGLLEGSKGKTYFIRDNGAGFDMKKTAKLFEPFQRLHAAGEFKGTGIGLATVERIVKRHGGRVWGEAEPEKGATFYFTFN